MNTGPNPHIHRDSTGNWRCIKYGQVEWISSSRTGARTWLRTTKAELNHFRRTFQR